MPLACHDLTRFCTQLSRDDPSANKTLSRASLGLAIYGMFVFVFWWVFLCVSPRTSLTDHSALSLSFNIYGLFQKESETLH